MKTTLRKLITGLSAGAAIILVVLGLNVWTPSPRAYGAAGTTGLGGVTLVDITNVVISIGGGTNILPLTNRWTGSNDFASPVLFESSFSVFALFTGSLNISNWATFGGPMTNTGFGFGQLQANASGGISSVAIPNINLANSTNAPLCVNTNNGGGTALVFGQPGTPSTLYDTNITANTTLAPFNIPLDRGSGCMLYASCSGGTDRTLTFPNGCVGPGLGTPPVVTITNAKAAWFQIVCKPLTSTNVTWSAVY